MDNNTSPNVVIRLLINAAALAVVGGLAAMLVAIVLTAD